MFLAAHNEAKQANSHRPRTLFSPISGEGGTINISERLYQLSDMVTMRKARSLN